MKTTKLLSIAAALVGLLVLGAPTPGRAQGPHHQGTTPHPTAKSGQREGQESPKTERGEEHREMFRGIAKKLGTTPAALQAAFQTAKQANPKLTMGQFVAANMLAHNLGPDHPAITTQAILDGLKSGKSIGQTLQSLGLSKAEADKAEDEAGKDARAAERQADKAEKDANKDASKPDSAK